MPQPDDSRGVREVAATPSLDGIPPLRPEQVSSWRTRGFALVDGVIPAELIDRAHAEAARSFPPAGSREAEAITDFGSGGRMVFPASSPALDEMTLHPRLLAAVAQLLGVDVPALRLTQSELWAKYARRDRKGGARDNTDQRIHVDYPNHTLVHPPVWDEPEAVELLLYLSDVDEAGGPTAVVPREGPEDPAYRWPIVDTPGVGGIDWINDRPRAEAHLEDNAPHVARFRADHLYPRERLVRYRPGTLLLYRHDTWHRGTPLTDGAMRLVVNMTFRKATSDWISVLHPGWAWAMYRRGAPMERLIAAASVEQRAVLGFPMPGHAYWTEATVEAVSRRYGPYGFDATPYANALPGAR